MSKGMIGYVKEEMKNTRLSGYSIEYSDVAKGIGGTDRLLTAEEHTAMSALDFEKNYESREALYHWYFNYLSNIEKLDVVTKIVNLIKSTGSKKIISLGCGPGVLEYLIKIILGDEIDIVALDYDGFLVDKGNALLGDKVKFDRFDFYNDDVVALCNRTKADMIIMIGSACSMDNEMYERFLSDCKRTEVKYILSFEAAVGGMAWRVARAKFLLVSIKHYFQRVPHMMVKAGHAYNRSISELKRIYKKSGWKTEKIEGLVCYPISFCLHKD